MSVADELRDQFAAVFADLDANPRPLVLPVRSAFAIDLEAGEPVFVADGCRVRANYRGRWLAEHPVPLSVRPGMKLKFQPTSGNRVKVRA